MVKVVSRGMVLKTVCDDGDSVSNMVREYCNNNDGGGGGVCWKAVRNGLLPVKTGDDKGSLRGGSGRLVTKKTLKEGKVRVVMVMILIVMNTVREEIV